MGIEFRNVWRKADAAVASDARGLWTELGVLPPAERESRARELCVVGYDGARLVAISTAYVEPIQHLRQRFAFVRVLVHPDYRDRGVVVPLTVDANRVLETWAQTHPDEKVAGTAGIIITPGVMKGGYTTLGWVLVGYTPDNFPLVVNWFRHYRF